MEKNKKQIWELIAAQLSNENNEKQQKQLNELLDENLSDKEAFDDTQAIWDDCANINKPAFDLQAAWQNAESKISNTEKRKIKKPSKQIFYRIAAAVLILFGATIFYFMTLNNKKVELSEVTKAVEVIEMTMPDGSFAELNKGAEIRYPKQFETGKREVFFEGEGYFDIQPNSKKPFLIRTSASIIRVLGTAFYVKSDNKNGVEVLVEEGSVELSTLNKQRKIVLIAGEQGKLFPSGEITKSKADANYKSWKTGVLIFENTPLQKVLTDLSDYYNVNFEIESKQLYNKKLNARFKEESFNNILEILKLTLGVEIEKHNNTYRLIQISELQNE